MQLWFKMRSWIALANGDHRSLNSSSIVDQAISDRPPTTPVAILHLGKGDQRSLSSIHRAAREGFTAIAPIETTVTHARILWLITLRGTPLRAVLRGR